MFDGFEFQHDLQQNQHDPTYPTWAHTLQPYMTSNFSSLSIPPPLHPWRLAPGGTVTAEELRRQCEVARVAARSSIHFIGVTSGCA